MDPYRGRFAPSPTGPLHFGSLVAAVGSYLEAKSRGGAWLLRMEDLDPPREQPGAAERILRTLEACGMGWDGDVMYQSQRSEAYRTALARLEAQGLVYVCGCSRREIADSGLSPDGAHIYPGTCRTGLAPGKTPRATRIRVGDTVIEFEDAVQGKIRQDLAAEAGDFVLLRADGLYAYQLAVVIDDAEQGITDVVRGADLLDSTPRQIYLQRLLGLRTPRYLHLPATVNAAGEKLSKQTRAAPVDERDPVPALAQVMEFLGQAPPAQLRRAPLAEFWRWALAHWDAQRIPRRRSLPAT
ncbi:MAG: tRNA glutamyl-Q(34) synthetase GluQRS [Betaproteobacteria bacterium]|nr:tRNA glutamyl-Q(34) synthetase GluQRS [Betaproteobacteria bacterium]